MTSDKSILALFLFIGMLAAHTLPTEAEMSKEERFEELNALNWEQTFHDPGTEDWREKWFLDGLKSTVENTDKGMILAAGPIDRDHACHTVLWTKESFEGDVKIEMDYWRLDTVTRNVNIMYIQATGKEEGPYTKDIAEWSHLREIPYMRTYFNNMNLLHISYAAHGNSDDSREYVRARRYPTKPDRPFSETDIPPDNWETGLFEPGVKHRFTFIKKGHELLFKVVSDEKTAVFAWDTSDFDPVTEGRIGIRHMFTRTSRYADIRISVLKD